MTFIKITIVEVYINLQTILWIEIFIIVCYIEINHGFSQSNKTIKYSHNNTRPKINLPRGIYPRHTLHYLLYRLWTLCMWWIGGNIHSFSLNQFITCGYRRHCWRLTDVAICERRSKLKFPSSIDSSARRDMLTVARWSRSCMIIHILWLYE